MSDFTGKWAFELQMFQDKCREALKLYNYWKQNPSSEERFCNDCFEARENTLSEAIREAYHSVLFPDTVSEDERYFFERPRCGLLEWSEDVNPYKDLQDISSGFFRRQDIRLADFELVFTKFHDLLKTHISDERLIEELYEIWKPLETKYSKYTRRFLEQH